jgi:hypothetical protein
MGEHHVLSLFFFNFVLRGSMVERRVCDLKEGGRQNNQPDDLYGLHRVGSFEILKQTTTFDLFSHSSSQNILVSIRWSLNRHCLYSYSSVELIAGRRTHTLHSQKWLESTSFLSPRYSSKIRLLLRYSLWGQSSKCSFDPLNL